MDEQITEQKMKASEMITLLHSLINEHGDLDMCVGDWSEEWNVPTFEVFIEYDGKLKRFIINPAPGDIKQ